MRVLVDADMLVYQVAFGAQYKDEETGEVKVKGFDSCVDLLNQIVKEIKEETWSDQEPVMYLTGDTKLLKLENKKRKREGLNPLTFTPNFREAVCKTTVYKGGRVADKPSHYDNVRTYMLSQYDYKIAWGMEADDLLCIDHRLDPDNTIIASRDKDLRICPGKHYGWTCGNIASFGPVDVDELGHVELDGKRKLKGCGLKFFYSQLLTGDKVDNIPGVPGKGDVFAYNLLSPCESEEDLHRVTSDEYRLRFGDAWEDYFLEQARLLWMIQELDSDGNPVMFTPYHMRT